MVGIYGYVMIGVVALFLLPRAWSGWIGWPIIVFGILMAPSRLILGVHWPSDVIGGWVYGSMVALAVSGVAIIVMQSRRERELVDDATLKPPDASEAPAASGN